MLTIDVFCEVIDNFGDIGFVYRFSKSLYNKYDKNVKIRVILNSTSELGKLNKEIKDDHRQVVQGIEYVTFEYLNNNQNEIIPSEVIVESFGCNLPDWYYEKAKSDSSILINLEYLSSEDWTIDFHLMESLIGAPKLRKYFFMPGLSEKSGGVLLTEQTLDKVSLSDYSEKLTISFLKNKLIGSIFSYEHNFTNLLNSLNKLEKESILLCLGEKTQASLGNLLCINEEIGYKGKFNNVHILFLPFVEQEKYDALLPLCDFNFVRGEDSFVRAVLSKKPFLWHIYLQEDMVHLDKMDGFLKIYKKHFKGTDYSNDMKNYEKLSIDYNTRVSNSFENNPNENFDYFLTNLNKYQNISLEFGEHTNKNCSLIDNFYNFINLKLR